MPDQLSLFHRPEPERERTLVDCRVCRLRRVYEMMVRDDRGRWRCTGCRTWNDGPHVTEGDDDEQRRG